MTIHTLAAHPNITAIVVWLSVGLTIALAMRLLRITDEPAILGFVALFWMPLAVFSMPVAAIWVLGKTATTLTFWVDRKPTPHEEGLDLINSENAL